MFKKLTMSSFDRDLINAAKEGRVDEIRHLVGVNGANARAQDVEKKTALIWAAQKGHLECVKALLPHSFAAKVDDDGSTALHWAATKGHVDCVEFLATVIDPNKKNHQGATALQEATAGAGDTRCVAFLATISDANNRDKHGRTALMIATNAGRFDCLSILLPLSQASAVDQEGRHALIYAANCSGHTPHNARQQAPVLRCVEALMPLSDLDWKDGQGRTAFDVAAGLGQWACMDLLATEANRAIMDKVAKDLEGGFARHFPRWSARMEAEQLAKVAGLSVDGDPGLSGSASPCAVEVGQADSSSGSSRRKPRL